MAVMMQPGDIITIQLADKERRPIGLDMVEITISFFLKQKFRYAFSFGPTDQQGRVRVSYDNITDKAVRDILINLVEKAQ